MNFILLQAWNQKYDRNDQQGFNIIIKLLDFDSEGFKKIQGLK